MTIFVRSGDGALTFVAAMQDRPEFFINYIAKKGTIKKTL